MTPQPISVSYSKKQISQLSAVCALYFQTEWCNHCAMMISVMHVPDLSDGLPASFPGTSHIYRKEHPAYLSSERSTSGDVGFVLAGCSEMFLCKNEREKEVMVRSWLDSNEQKEERVLAKIWGDGPVRKISMMSLFGWDWVEWLAVLARKDVRERCDIAPRPSCHQAAAVS